MWLWHRLGQRAERHAERFLIRQGLRVLTRNYRSRWGEIDLVLHDDDTLVFTEVRYRSDNRFGSPVATVTGDKQRRLRKTALDFIRTHPAQAGAAMRFDVIGITPGSPNNPAVVIDWIQAAFEA